MANKVIVFGIDGGDLAMLDPWLNDNDMPFLSNFLKNNKSGEITCEKDLSLGWPTIITGKSPESHMCYYWMGKNRQAKRKRFAIDSNFIGNETLWTLLGAAGVKCGLVGVPFTYPPQKVNGFLLSGPGGGLHSTPGMKVSYPESLESELIENNINYQIKWSDQRAHSAPIEYVNRVNEVTKGQNTAAIYCIKKYSPDFFMMVFRGNDSILHRASNLIKTKKLNIDKRLEKAIRRYYRLIDNGMQQIYSLMSAEKKVDILLVTDHGFGPCKFKYNIDEWLRRKKLLKFNYRPLIQKILNQIPFFSFYSPEVNWIDMEKTVIYRDSTNSMSLNDKVFNKSRKSKHGDRTAFLNQIVKELEQIAVPSFGNIFKSIQVLDKIKITGAGLKSYSPDIIFEPTEGLYVDGGFNLFEFRKRIIHMENKGFYTWAGTHREKGLFGFKIEGYEISKKDFEKIQLIDIAPTILKLFKIEKPSWMQGKSFY